MDPIIIIHWLLVLLESHSAQLARMANLEQYIWRISTPSPITDFVASSLSASTVTITKVSFTASHFTSTQWLSPSSATTTSTPTFLPSDILEPIAVETLEPGSSAIDSLLISTWIVLAAALLLWIGYRLGQITSSIYLHMTEGVSLSWSESTIANLDNDWRDNDSFQPADADGESLPDIATLQTAFLWHLAADKLESDAKESNLINVIAHSSKQKDTLSRRLKTLEQERQRCQ